MGIQHLKEGYVSGILLGDGYLDSGQRRIRLQHTLSQYNYLKFKLALLEQMGFSCRCYNTTKVRTNLGVYDYCTGSASGGDVGKYYAYSLKDLLRELNPLGLMIWWMDDGNLSIHSKANRNGSVSRFGYLNTQRHGLAENQYISQVLSERFGVDTRIHTDSKSGFAKQDYYRIYINAVNMRRVIDLVREFIPWVPKDMLYKFNMKYVVNRNPESPYLATHYNF